MTTAAQPVTDARFRVLTDHADIVRHIQPVMKSIGSDIPTEGHGVVFAQFGEDGKVEAFQIVQDAIFAEGLVSLTPKAQLRRIWHMMKDWLEKSGNVKGRDLIVIASSEKIGRACELMGCEPTDWKVYRRKF